MKIKIEREHIKPHIESLLTSTPVTAARHDLLGLLTTVLDADAPVFAGHLQAAAEPLCEALGVATVHDVWRGMVALPGRPPRAVASALRRPEMVSALYQGLECQGWLSLAKLAASWGPQEYGDMATVPLTAGTLAQRVELVDQLRERTLEIIAHWRKLDTPLGRGPSRVDGRSLASAARVWQVPAITGSLGEVPSAPSALYPNRLGRSAAAVAFARANAALDSVAPDSWVFEPLALLIAVGESVCPASWSPGDVSAAMHGSLSLKVRCGQPIGDEVSSLAHWWSVLSAWGSSARRAAIAVPTAWRLNEAHGDVVVWALCSAAVRLAVASTAPSRMTRLASGSYDWDAHVVRELPTWESGALSVWTLMQRGRQVQRRTAWPAVSAPVLKDATSWPWRSDSLGSVPADLEESA
jgi:hypothetical protein